MAPFQGITNSDFRYCYTKHFCGIDKIFTPYFAGIQEGTKFSAHRLLELSNTEVNSVPVTPQILSKDAEEILRFAKIIQDKGFNELNWNLGCPFPQVADKKRGAGLLPYSEQINKILEFVFSKININLSIKCRLGYNDANEIDLLIPIFEKHPISELIIHARTGKQLYKGQTNQAKFKEIADKLIIKPAYNGDIFTKTDFDNLLENKPDISTLMIGRGALIDPFLPARIKDLNIKNEKQTIRKFIEDLYLLSRKKTNNNLSTLGYLKEIWTYLSYSFSEPEKTLKKIRKTKSFEEYETVVGTAFFEL